MVWGDKDLASINEAVLGARIGYVGPSAYIFSASVRENLFYGLKQRPIRPAKRDDAAARKRLAAVAEARRAGNSDLDHEADWVDLQAAGVDTPAEIDARLLQLLAKVDLSEDIYTLGLRGRIDPDRQPARAAAILAARAALAARLEEPDLRGLVERFDPQAYNTNASIAEKGVCRRT